MSREVASDLKLRSTPTRGSQTKVLSGRKVLLFVISFINETKTLPIN
jgi:hypothetical protein